MTKKVLQDLMLEEVYHFRPSEKAKRAAKEEKEAQK